jgi:cytochrome P450 family 135
MALPPGPRIPEALQTIEWMARPTAFLRRCGERFGDVFTIRVSTTGAPMVLTSDTDLVRRLFTDHAEVARGGVGKAV